MKRFAPLLLVVVALAVVPLALADNEPPSVIGGTTTAAPTGTTAKTAKHAPGLRLEIIRLQLRLAQLRHRVACHDASSDSCTAFTQKVVDRLTTLDGNVQKKLDDLQCTSDSTDKKCTVLSKLDQRLQDVLSKLNA